MSRPQMVTALERSSAPCPCFSRLHHPAKSAVQSDVLGGACNFPCKRAMLTCWLQVNHDYYCRIIRLQVCDEERRDAEARRGEKRRGSEEESREGDGKWHEGLKYQQDVPTREDFFRELVCVFPFLDAVPWLIQTPQDALLRLRTLMSKKR
eukprot:402090-Hanusia_phi.AAC.1